MCGIFQKINDISDWLLCMSFNCQTSGKMDDRRAHFFLDWLAIDQHYLCDWPVNRDRCTGHPCARLFSLSWTVTMHPPFYVTTNVSNLIQVVPWRSKPEQTFKEITRKQQCGFLQRFKYNGRSYKEISLNEIKRSQSHTRGTFEKEFCGFNICNRGTQITQGIVSALL